MDEAEDDEEDGTDLEDEISLSLCLSNGCYQDGQYEEAIFTGQVCLQKATKKGNDNASMTACLVIGESELKLNEYENAISHLIASLEIATAYCVNEVEMKASMSLAQAHCALRHYYEAFKYAQRCNDIAMEITCLPYEGKSSLAVSEIYCALGEYENAISVGMRALKIGRKTRDIHTEMKSCLFIAMAYKALNNYDEAIIYAWECIHVANDKHVEMKACLFLTETYYSLGDSNRENAIQCALMLYHVANDIGDDKNAMDACCVIMMAKKSLGEYKEAVDYAKIYLEFAKKFENQREEMQICWFIAGTQSDAGNHAEAVRYAEMCLEIAKETRDKKEEMETCRFIVCTLSTAGNHADAVRYAEMCLEIAKETRDKKEEMETCRFIICTLSNAGNHTEAVRYAEMCLEIAKETRDKKEEMETCRFIACTLSTAGNHAEAVKYGLMWADIATEIGDKNSEIDACFLIGGAGRVLKSPEEILQHATKRMAMEQEPGGGNKKIGCLLLGLVHCNMGKYNEAISHLGKAIDHARDEEDEYGKMKIYHSQEVTHCHLQQIHNAISCCEKSIQIAKKIGAKEWEMKRSLRLAQLYKMANRSDEVEVYATIALGIAQDLGDKETQRNANIFLGDLHSKSGQDSKASTCFNESVDIAKETGNTFTEIFASSLAPISSLSDAKKRIGKIPDMLKGFSLSVHTMTETDFEGVFSFICSIQEWLMLLIKACVDATSKEAVIHSVEKMMQKLKPKNSLDYSIQPLIPSVQNSMNVLPLKTEEKAAMEKFLHRIAEHEKSTNKFPDSFEEYLINIRKMFTIILEVFKVAIDVFCFQATCHSIIGMTHYFLDDVQNAKASFIEATKCFESLFNGVGVDKSKISIVDKYADIYKLLSIIFIEDGNTEEALSMAENCRAKALKDILTLMYGLDKEGFQEDHFEFDDMLPVLKALESSIIFYTESFHGIHKFVMEDGKGLQFSVQPLLLPDLSFKNLIKGVYKELKVSSDFHCKSPWWLPRTSKLLKCGEMNEILTQTGREMVAKKALEDGVNLEELEECDWKEIDDSLKGMLKDIFEDKENSMPSPAPFSFDAIEGESSFTSALETLSHQLLDNVPLDQDEVVIIPDGLLSIVPFAALTNPATGNYLSEDKKIRYAPSLTTLKMLSESREDFYMLNGAILIGDPDVSRVPCVGEPVKQLPGAEKEVKVIANLYFHVTPLTGKQATKPAVLEKLREGASVVHIAAHGDLDKATILLAPDSEVEGVPGEDDYMLTMADVQEAKIRAQLVVLSCCYSGRGEIKAEGVVGMCRAFLASGARAVVASMWAIDDEATLEFMGEFYEYLQSGESASTSLQLAMKEIREMDEYSDPKYWAPFFLMGDDVTIKF